MVAEAANVYSGLVAIPFIHVNVKLGRRRLDLFVDAHHWGMLERAERNVLLLRRGRPSQIKLSSPSGKAFVMRPRVTEAYRVLSGVRRLYEVLYAFVVSEGVDEALTTGLSRLKGILLIPHPRRERNPLKAKALEDAIACLALLDELFGRRALLGGCEVVGERLGYYGFIVVGVGDNVVVYKREGEVDKVYTLLARADRKFRNSLLEACLGLTPRLQ